MRTIYSAIFNNILLKISAFFLAILVWSYVATQLYMQVHEATSDSQPAVEMADTSVIVKKVPIHVNLIGTPAGNSQVQIDKIRVYPSECVVTGPLKDIESLFFITTEPISIEGATKTIRGEVRLKQSPGCAISNEHRFSVIIPIIQAKN